jgi:CheY-like chemotaxis protein
VIRILVVDDDAWMRDSTSRILESEGWEAVPANEGKEALAKLAEERFDLVVTDLVMPGMEGIETIARLRKLNPATPVIAVSGGGRTFPGEYLTLATQLGASLALAKPFDRRELIEAVRSVLRLGEPPGPP